MRFAIGSVPQLEQFMSGINMGGLAQGATDLRSKEKAAGIGLQGQVGGAGLRAKGQAISGGILGDATAAAGRSAMMGQIFQTLGQVGGSAISKFGSSYGGFGSTGGAGDTFTPGSVSKYGDVVRNPLDDIRAAGIEINGPLRDGQVF